MIVSLAQIRVPALILNSSSRFRVWIVLGLRRKRSEFGIGFRFWNLDFVLRVKSLESNVSGLGSGF